MRTTAISQRPTSRACGEASRNATAIGVDIPIGLPTVYPRAADTAARRFVGARGSSVFPTPLRDALLAATHAEATACHFELCGTGISRQTFELRHKILELEAIAEHDERIVEVHPEVSFAELHGGPLAAAKKTADGRALRRRLLAGACVDVPDVPRGLEVDILDAAVAAWSARRYARGDAKPLPETHDGRVGAIWR